MRARPPGPAIQGGPIWVVDGELGAEEVVLEREGMCAAPPEPYDGIWHTLSPAQGLPSTGDLEVF